MYLTGISTESVQILCSTGTESVHVYYLVVSGHRGAKCTILLDEVHRFEIRPIHFSKHLRFGDFVHPQLQ